MNKGWLLPLIAVVVISVPVGLFASENAGDVEPSERHDVPWERAFEQALEEGRQAYNEGDYREASEAFRRAIQVQPEKAEAYRNLARSLNMLDEYGEATHFYEHYLEIAGEADDIEQVEAEREDTARRAGDDRRRLPTSQRMARRALEREIREGRALGEGQSGALGLFRGLLETGYAEPDLAELRRDLDRQLSDEIGEAWDDEGQWLPVLDDSDWQRQWERLEGRLELVRDEDALQELERGMELVEVGQALMAGDYEAVLGRTDQGDDDLGLRVRYQVAAKAGLGEYGEALKLLEGLMEEPILGEKGLEQAEMLRIQFKSAMGEAEEASESVRQGLDRR